MADIIHAAESRGLVRGERVPKPDSELSPDQLAETLRVFAPESPAATTTSPIVDVDPAPSKKRKFHNQTTFLPDQTAEDVQMDEELTQQAIGPVARDDSFQKFLTAIQQHNVSNESMATDVDDAGELQPAQPDALPATDPQNVASSALLPSPASQFDQLAPFMDLVDWDASLEHFLNTQCDASSFDWSSANTMQ